MRVHYFRSAMRSRRPDYRSFTLLLCGAATAVSAATAPHELAPCSSPAARVHIEVADRFGRALGSNALLLPDWEGYMANPAIRMVLTPPDGARFPLALLLRSSDPLVHFDSPATVDEGGASKHLTFENGTAQTVYVAAFPQRARRHLRQPLRQHVHIAANGQPVCSVPVDITLLAAAPPQPTRAISIDYSHDRTGFYDRPEHRAVFEQAAADWAFYLDSSADTLVRTGEELTHIWHPDGYKRGRWTSNAAPYVGYLLYAYGVRSPELRSGGAPTVPAKRAIVSFVPVDGRPRAGTVEIEVQGNYNTLGWLPATLPDRQWWRATNREDVPNDLYSIMHHEIGHALFFHPAHPGFVRQRPLSLAPRFELRQRPLTPGTSDHFDDGLDPVSLRGIFGAEYHGRMTPGRWLITRTDLLAIEALGARLRPVAALQPLSLPELAASPALRGLAYTWQPQAGGGVPAYDWDIESGMLPPGLALDRHTGRISGVPSAVGTFELALRVRDSADTSAVATQAIRITVRAPKHLRVVAITPKLAATRQRDRDGNSGIKQ